MKPVEAIVIPVLDLTPYYEHASAIWSGVFIQSAFHWFIRLCGSRGVMWEYGTFRRSGSGNFTGCVIATGNVDVSGSGNYNK